jgi:hypothetical protein
MRKIFCTIFKYSIFNIRSSIPVYPGWDTEMHHLSCGEIWGGIRNCDDDVASAGFTESLYSFASDGGRG